MIRLRRRQRLNDLCAPIDVLTADLVVIDGKIVKNRWGNQGVHCYMLLARPEAGKTPKRTKDGSLA